MASRTIDVILYEEDGTWTATSPQVPGLVAGRDSNEELIRDLPEILRFAGVEPANMIVRPHREALIPTPSGDLIIRLAGDEHYEERREVAIRIEAAVGVDAQREDMFDAPRMPTGEVLYICGVASDTIRWCAEQLHPRGDGAVVATCVADGFIWAAHLLTGADRDERGRSLAHFGLSLDATLSEVMRSQVIANRPRRLLVNV